MNEKFELYFDKTKRVGNDSIKSESLEIVQTICDDSQLRFGKVCAKQFKINVDATQDSYKGEAFKFLITQDGLEKNYGTYKVYSDKKTDNKLFRQIVAYDDIYYLQNLNVVDWYLDVFEEEDTKISLKDFRRDLFAYLRFIGFDIYEEDVNLPNDNIVIGRTLAFTNLDGDTVIQGTLKAIDVIQSICEINGCFGYLDFDNTFRFVYLDNNVYGKTLTSADYVSMKYEDYTCNHITMIEIQYDEDSIGAWYGDSYDTDNVYSITGNFLCLGLEMEELESIAEAIFHRVSGIEYKPVELTLYNAEELILGTKYDVSYCIGNKFNETVTSYVLKLTITGMNSFKYKVESKGTDTYDDKLPSITSDYKEIAGKYNRLVRTVDETKSEIYDVARGLNSRITQTAEAISTEVTRATTEEGKLSSQIKETADNITLQIENIQSQIDGEAGNYIVQEIPTLTNYPAWDFTYNILCDGTHYPSDSLYLVYNDDYYKKNVGAIAYNENNSVAYRFLKNAETNKFEWFEIADTEYSQVLKRVTALEVKDGQIESSIKTIQLDGKELESRVAQTEKEISSKVSNGTFESYKTQTAKEISSKVSNGNVISSINQSAEAITIDADKISLAGKQINLTSDNITIKSNNFSVTKEGTVTMKNADISGKVTASSGEIGGWFIGSDALIAKRNGTQVGYFKSNQYSSDDSYNCIELYSDNLNLKCSNKMHIKSSYRMYIESTQENVYVTSKNTYISGTTSTSLKSGSTGIDISNQNIKIGNDFGCSINVAGTLTANGKINEMTIISSGIGNGYVRVAGNRFYLIYTWNWTTSQSFGMYACMITEGRMVTPIVNNPYVSVSVSLTPYPTINIVDTAGWGIRWKVYEMNWE